MGIIERITGMFSKKGARGRSTQAVVPENVPNAYIAYGANAVLVREHLLIGRSRPKGTKNGVDGSGVAGTEECYAPDVQRPKIRLMARHQIVVPDTLPDRERISISRHHALILYTPDQANILHIVDPASLTGVYVNSVRIKALAGGPETLKDDPQTLDEALRCSQPLSHLDRITFRDPSDLPSFYLTVVIAKTPLEHLLPPQTVGQEAYSFL